MTGSNPAHSLSITSIPAGTWLVEGYAASIGISGEDSADDFATLALTSSAPQTANSACYGNENNRYLAAAFTLTSAGSASCGLALTSSNDNVFVDDGCTAISMVLKVTRLS